MKTVPSLTDAQLEQLRLIDSSLLANAIEAFGIRLRNTGFTDSTIHCLFPDFPSMAGYAATARLRTSEPPMEGHSYINRTDWWNHILSIRAPRVVVVEDVDKRHGLGAFIGGVHANILAALSCVGVVTNGAVRDSRVIRSLGMQVFAANTAVSHAYAHIFDFGSPINVGGLKIEPGELLHGGAHGVQSVPLTIAPRIPQVAQEIAKTKRQVISFCHSRNFSMEGLRSMVREIDVQETRRVDAVLGNERETSR